MTRDQAIQVLTNDVSNDEELDKACKALDMAIEAPKAQKIEPMSCQECDYWEPTNRFCIIAEICECAYEPKGGEEE